MREPMLIPVIGLAAGILLQPLAFFSHTEMSVAAALFLLLAVLAWRAGSVRLRLVCTGLCFAAAGVLTSLWHAPGPAPSIEATASEVVRVAGCVIEPPVLSPVREQFLLEIEPGLRAHVTFTLREGEQPPLLHYGERIEFDGRIRRPRNFGNPGAFDYVSFLERQHIYWNISARTGTDVDRRPGRCGDALNGAIFRLRTAALERIERLYPGDSYNALMMEAILIGENSRLEKAWTEHFRRSGTYHALVISGLHVTVLAGVLLFLLRYSLGSASLALTITMFAAWIYAAVAGMSAPVVRAAGGFTLYLAASHFYRRPRLLNVMAIIGIAFLLCDPRQLFEASFQLSFLTVVAIGALAEPLFTTHTKPIGTGMMDLEDPAVDIRREPGVSELRVEMRLLAETLALWTGRSRALLCRILSFTVKILVAAVELFLLSTIVQIAMALPMAIFFHRVSLSGLIANVIVVPAMTLVVPIGFGAVFTGWHWLANIAALLLAISKWTAIVCLRFEPPWRIPNPPLALSVAYAAALLVLAMAARTWPLLRRFAVVSVGGLFAAIVLHPFAPVHSEGLLEVSMIDVGQGDCLLIYTPDGHTMLIDAGGIPQFKGRPKAKMDIGEDVVSPYLWTRSIRHIDLMVLTHAHDDHSGGMDALIENFRPTELWTGAMGESAVWQRVRDAARRFGVRIVPRHAGERVAWGGVGWEILAPYADQPASENPHNNDSLAMRLTYGKKAFLFTGDMEKQVEARLLEENRVQQVNVLKVGHHGSRTSTTQAFLEKVNPVVALISDGQDNLYHHPHPDVVKRLHDYHVGIYRTDLNGLIRIVTDGQHLDVERIH